MTKKNFKHKREEVWPVESYDIQPEERSVIMDVGNLKHLLREMGEECLKLSEKLSDRGEPLNRRQEDILKMVKFGYLQGCLQEAAMMWFMNNKEDCRQSLKQLIDNMP